MHARCGGAWPGEECNAVDRIQAICAAAEFATHLDLAEFHDHRVDLVAAQCPQRVFDAFPLSLIHISAPTRPY